MYRKWLGLLCCLSLALGCAQDADQIAPKKSNGEESTASELEGRLNAAMSMSDINQRDLAIQALVENAATAGDGEVVKRAIGEISDINLRDKAAAAAALSLAAEGKTQIASEVAKMVSDYNLRDEVLGKIAKGER